MIINHVLTEADGEVSKHIMDWIRIWLDSELENVKYHIYIPYMIQILRGFVKLHSVENLEVFIEFVYEMCYALLGLDITILIVPYICRIHWSVYILGD